MFSMHMTHVINKCSMGVYNETVDEALRCEKINLYAKDKANQSVALICFI